MDNLFLLSSLQQERENNNNLLPPQKLLRGLNKQKNIGSKINKAQHEQERDHQYNTMIQAKTIYLEPLERSDNKINYNKFDIQIQRDQNLFGEKLQQQKWNQNEMEGKDNVELKKENINGEWNHAENKLRQNNDVKDNKRYGEQNQECQFNGMKQIVIKGSIEQMVENLYDLKNETIDLNGMIKQDLEAKTEGELGQNVNNTNYQQINRIEQINLADQQYKELNNEQGQIMTSIIANEHNQQSSPLINNNINNKIQQINHLINNFSQFKLPNRHNTTFNNNNSQSNSQYLTPKNCSNTFQKFHPSNLQSSIYLQNHQIQPQLTKTQSQKYFLNTQMSNSIFTTKTPKKSNISFNQYKEIHANNY